MPDTNSTSESTAPKLTARSAAGPSALPQSSPVAPVHQDIAHANVRVYNALAGTYRASRATYRQAVHYALGPLAVHLCDAGGGRPAEVLDMGSGAGVHTESMVRHGHFVTAVDAAPDLLQVVKDNVPEATCVVADFWQYEPERQFDCVIAASFIHLFPKDALPVVLRRLASWLVPNERSVIFLATVPGPSNDGDWIAKEENHGGAKRWRVVYEEGELLRALDAAGFDVVYRWYDPDHKHEGKLWLDMMVRPRVWSSRSDVTEKYDAYRAARDAFNRAVKDLVTDACRRAYTEDTG